MLSTFFSTSKPIHYLTVLITVVLSIIISLVLSSHLIWQDFIPLLVLPAALAIFQFIVTKNDLTPSSTYALFTASLISLLYIVFKVPVELLVALSFSLLAMRRLLSLKSGLVPVKKIFDASFWIAIASIFYAWSTVFYVMVFIAIFLYARNDFRNWITPFIAMSCVWILLFTYDYVWEHEQLHRISSSFFTSYLWEHHVFEIKTFIPLMLLGIAIIGLFVYISKVVNIPQSTRPRFTIIMFSGLCSLVIALLNFESFIHGGFLFLIPALSILWAQFAHAVKHKIVVELLLWFPVLLFVWGLLLN
ncbi:hypothetical protein [Nonlabens sp.]|uniref:hypothetical protein n=1 Tax=Nonlabens sp. TaxID=1888209 RepID=UPI003F697D60